MIIPGLSGQSVATVVEEDQLSEQLLSARSGWPAVDDHLPDAMTAVVFEEFGAPEVLQWRS